MAPYPIGDEDEKIKNINNKKIKVENDHLEEKKDNTIEKNVTLDYDSIIQLILDLVLYLFIWFAKIKFIFFLFSFVAITCIIIYILCVSSSSSM